MTQQGVLMFAKWTVWLSRCAAFIFDVTCIPIAWFTAYWLRFNLGVIPSEILQSAIWSVPSVIAIQAFAFYGFGLYRGVWRFASLPDLSRILKSIMVGSLTILAVLFLIIRLEHIPRSVIPLYGMVLLLMLGGARFGVRWLKDKRGLIRATQERVLIVGAGVAGEGLARDLLRDPHQGFCPIAFVDDRPQKIGRDIYGIRVAGSLTDIEKIVKKYAIDRILIAVPSANAATMRRIVELCATTGKPVRTLPGVNDLLTGKISVSNLREISLEDLLGRDQVELDWEAIYQVIHNKKIMVTGGGGSIGSELCRQVLKHNPSALIVIDNSEYNVFQLQQELNEKESTKLFYHLADICDTVEIRRLMQDYQPDIVFHAAAFKHVPMLEPQIRSAVKNNILGTYSLAESAVAEGVSHFVLVSSDKAVNPSNVMGTTKRVAEMICQYFNQYHSTKFITVRFGNVLGSKGSVVETFQKQLQMGGPLTVTSPEMTRFFMTIQEASQLILQALAIGQGGELFVLDMGEPVKIKYLAEQVIRLAGKLPDVDIHIQYTGLRPGEKMYEELFHNKEKNVPTQHIKILKAESRKLDAKQLEISMAALKQNCLSGQDMNLVENLKILVPEQRCFNKELKPAMPQLTGVNA